jgi:hypothetical protein
MTANHNRMEEEIYFEAEPEYDSEGNLPMYDEGSQSSGYSPTQPSKQPRGPPENKRSVGT